ncbi:hypothetical protein Acy02nite_88980 [Actinoplanes cyaneus]|uniref:FAD dependent oxidoreductase domain-containing protein n=1 Tax=Actinoplanes cyaneus TaxID=52696 RepID=A0A919M9M6_9ACTN|nr:hypothetical protein Acy02nite_88980 [Actinoplanes cyaneus]
MIRWPGVVIVGGGAAGLLTALELDRRGVAALVLERGTLCCAQSGQAHGWLHRGGVYPDATAADRDQLEAGARRWAALAGDGTPLTECHIPGGRPEQALVPLRALRTALAGSTVALRQAEVIRIQPDPGGRTAAGLTVRTPDGTARLVADAYVLTAGAGIGPLMPAPDLLHRLSFMLVVRSAAVTGTGFAIPGQEALGLFAVPRATDTYRYLLLSNFISYMPSAQPALCRANWLAGIRPAVQRYLPGLWDAPDALWGIYPAIKAEPARRVALGVSDLGLPPTPYRNVVAGVPGKLTLAPLLAERLADAVTPYARTNADATPPATLPEATWGPEEWEVTALVRRSTLYPEDRT